MNSKRFCFTKGLFLLAILSSLGVFLSASVINGVENPVEIIQPVQDNAVASTSADTIVCGDVNGVGLPPYGNITLADADAKSTEAYQYQGDGEMSLQQGAQRFNIAVR